MEREEATDIIKKYGGKVTTNVSGRTNYVIVGEEAGESKMAKVRTPIPALHSGECFCSLWQTQKGNIKCDQPVYDVGQTAWYEGNR